MKGSLSALMLAAMVAAGACSRNNNKPADSALNTDLSLAAQQKGYQPLDSLSPAERANALTTPAPVTSTTRSSAGEVSRPRSTAPHRTSGSSTRSSGTSSGSSSGTVGTSSGTTSSGHVVKNTKRDAAIGAAAGAIIGATTSHNKVKGGVIGAAVGGILGGVIGNNVDKKKVP
jgi:hypothetical protein